MWALVGMLALACGLRVAALLSLATTPYFDTPRLDEALYHAWASQLASGTYEATSVYPAAPLPAYVMAVVYKVFSPNLLYTRISQSVFWGRHVLCRLSYWMAVDQSPRRYRRRRLVDFYAITIDDIARGDPKTQIE